MIDIPDRYRQGIIDAFHEEGESWLATLPATVEEFAERWSLADLGKPFDLSYNYVIPVTCGDGSEAVLKVSVPGGEYRGEMAALSLYNGEGCCQLLLAEQERGVMLLERLRPGTMLAEMADDEAATAVAAELMHKLWRPVSADHSFVTVEQWFQAFSRHWQRYGGVGPLDGQIFHAAEAIVGELLRANHPPMLLHGDYHHHNILQAERAPWLIIDPKGVVGDPCYEVGAFLYNPIGLHERYPNLQPVLERRVHQFSEILGFERERIQHWGIAQAVLSAVWTCESEGYGWEPTMAVARILLTLS